MTIKFRCEEHEYEWFTGSAGCPRCLTAQRDELLEALKAARAKLAELLEPCETIAKIDAAILRAEERQL